ncbi:cell division cycle-associated protein 4-like isoform X1 [Xiphophorus couchianus]|uniref:cell division cycle-associated protein 4-like isoform X1 n=2 Tax=Xiphophorus couchianus TaxID=32473 RepID=UPI0010170310|nr:cell division cycle-associated protein 4-like isoform X1 [Xiphophorus couchianus]
MDRTFLTLRISVVLNRRGGTKRSRGHDGFVRHMKSVKGTSMLGRGVKRKWSSLEGSEVEQLPDVAATEDKRPDAALEDSEEEDRGDRRSRTDAGHLQQRQVVLSLCLKKLQHYQAGVELSLRRSVLLINTLRQIQEEMQSDGTDVRLGGVSRDARLLRDDFREDESVTCPGCTEGDAESPSPPPSPEPTNTTPTDLHKPLPNAVGHTFSDAGSAMGYLSDLALDDIFEDIDTSMYESSELPSAWAAGSLWPVSVSFWPDDDDVKLCSSVGSLQSCLLDLNELDHIMEILVKS